MLPGSASIKAVNVDEIETRFLGQPEVSELIHTPSPSSSMVVIWPFLKWFSRNKMIWSFGQYKIAHLKPVLEKSEQNFQCFCEILTLNLSL